jgi:hypothetical protein
MSGEFPKVSAIVSSEPVSESQSLAMLIEFLTAEQRKPESSNHWEDIFLVSETLAKTEKEKKKLRDLRGLATLKSVEEVAPINEGRVVKGEPSSPQDKKLSVEKEELKTLEKAERKAAKAAEKDEKKAEKDEKKKRKEAKKERKENKKQKR